MPNLDMSRNEFLRAAGASGLVLAAASDSAFGARTTRPPNFIVILTDDQCFRGIGYNHPIVQTPNLNRLAGDGLIFDRAYVASPICVASRASSLTGLFPQQHGAISLDASGFLKNVVEERRYKTIAHALGEAGYLTGFCGKSHLGEPRNYGFQVGTELSDRTDEETFAFASNFLDERQKDGQPFFLWVAARQPHIPLQPTREWLDLYRDAQFEVDPNFLESPPSDSIYNQGLPGEHYYRDSDAKGNYRDAPSGPPRTKEQIFDFMRAYYASISHLDHQVGQLVERLKATGLYENTMIVNLSDNGYHLGNHGLGNKITMHEESVRIPMFVHGAALPRKGVRCEELVSSLDVYPTLLDLAGLDVPQHLCGQSLRPLLARPRRAVREYVASECVGVGGKPGMGHRMVRTDRWKYVLTDTNEEALFDEETDPYELGNAIADRKARPVLSRMREHMREWMARVGDTHAPPPA